MARMLTEVLSMRFKKMIKSAAYVPGANLELGEAISNQFYSATQHIRIQLAVDLTIYLIPVPMHLWVHKCKILHVFSFYH